MNEETDLYQVDLVFSDKTALRDLLVELLMEKIGASDPRSAPLSYKS